MDEGHLSALFDRLFTAAKRYCGAASFGSGVSTDRLSDGRYEVRVVPPGRNGVRWVRAARLVDAVAELAGILERANADANAEDDELDRAFEEEQRVRGAA